MIEVFIQNALKDAPAYKAWGELVASEILKGIILDEGKKEHLLKIPVQIRLKKESSIRGKIARYAEENAKNVVQDFVGVRFVVLFSSELQLIQDAIASAEVWESNLVRDFANQIHENPELFDYQSLHYILKCTKDIQQGSIKIRAGLTCEVQIRTLLQHAYAELTHDNIYKPTQLVPTKAKRFVARSMALMESTDELFCRTLDELRSANLPRNDLFDSLTRIFKSNSFWDERNVDPSLNFEIIDICRPMIDFSVILMDVVKFISEKQFILRQIAAARAENFLFSQPVVILLYYLVDRDDDALGRLWMLDSLKEELRLVFSNLGTALADRL
jgi:ppGpp synthetase/RelA/SpoT-type nucleotidyltranferase